MTGIILALIINFKIAIQKFMHNKTSIYQPLFTMWPFNTACHVNWMRIATLYFLINFHWYSRIAIDVLWWNLKNVGWVQTTFDIGLKYHSNKYNFDVHLFIEEIFECFLYIDTVRYKTSNTSIILFCNLFIDCFEDVKRNNVAQDRNSNKELPISSI